MNRARFIKEFQLTKYMRRSITRVPGENERDYLHRVKLAKYWLEGEERVNYELENIYLPIVCLSNVRIECNHESAQADFIVITKDKIFILEVKNLFGNIKVTKNGDVIRLLPRKYYIEEVGMENPFTQTQKQAVIFSKFLKFKGYNIPFEILVVMANPKTSIYLEGSYPMIRYDKINNFFQNKVSPKCSIEEYQKMVEIGKLLKDNHKDRFFNDFEVMKRRFEKHNRPLPNLSNDDLILYEELLEYRRKKAKEKNIPACNIFHNKDVEMLVKYKPINKFEFIRVPGFKERKYVLYGKDIIEIIKKYL